ncbi:MAG: nucleoside triphosphate pyrophosphohydrolase [Spirochaetes bacterium]|nr:nucleoside triphosphate pyrophosphohydrolase [Spirochaetota bacterium]
MKEKETAVKESFYRLYRIVKRLRSPGGCNWDREQSPETIRGNLIEESYECVDAIDNGDDANLREELGDIYLLVTMITEMKEEESSFSIEEVLDEISEKLIRRHPHVFGNTKIGSVKQIIDQWNQIKEKVEGKNNKNSILERVPRSLPPLERALEIQKKVSKIGFDWKSAEKIWDKLKEEELELINALEIENNKRTEEEFGDLFFTMVNLARSYKIDPSLALNRTNEKFIRRFQEVEKKIKAMGVKIENTETDTMDTLWNQVKSEEDANSSK